MEVVVGGGGYHEQLAVMAAGRVLLCLLIHAAWLGPAATRRHLRRAGLDGPRPSFPLGNLAEMSGKSSASSIIGDESMHASVFPYFARWRQAFGKVFVYWLGTEAFVYVSDPEFPEAATAGALGKRWGKPEVFRRDRKPMFGRGLVMEEGEEWARHRNIIAPAFSAGNLGGMVGVMREATVGMLERWAQEMCGGDGVVDVERGVVRNAAEIIGRASLGVAGQDGFQKLQAMQALLFQSNRLVGVPLARLLHVRKSYEAWRLGREIDRLLLGAGLSSREQVDECKTFFFGGHETTALAVSWTLLMLAAHPEWQDALREEVMQQPEDLGRLTKMGWVMREVLRLYPPSPNVLQDVEVSRDSVIPKGTNMWVDVVAMHRDPALWGADAHLFRPDRICVGRNLMAMEYRLVLAMTLRRFTLHLAPHYRHAPTVMLSLRPAAGIQLRLKPL